MSKRVPNPKFSQARYDYAEAFSRAANPEHRAHRRMACIRNDLYITGADDDVNVKFPLFVHIVQYFRNFEINPKYIKYALKLDIWAIRRYIFKQEV